MCRSRTACLLCRSPGSAGRGTGYHGGVEELVMALRLALCLPRDAATVTLVRRLLDQALRTLGVTDECRDDVGLVLTEACANVIEHARTSDEYDVSAEITDTRCIVEIINTGPAVDPTTWMLTPGLDVLAERGRGLQIINSLADEVTFIPGGEGGLTVRAVKVLTWRPDAPLWRTGIQADNRHPRQDR
jgi:serine/threonine-protein kinase RsbW